MDGSGADLAMMRQVGAELPPRSPWVRMVQRYPVGVVAAAVILLVAAAAAGADWLAPYDATAQDFAPLDGPSLRHPFGTDRFGRDVLSRTMEGSRVSLGVGLAAIALAGVLGTAMGVTSAYYGRRLDRAIQWLVDLSLAFPGLVALLAVVAAFGRSIVIVTVAIGLLAVPLVARLVRGAALEERGKEYVEAARALGCSPGRIMLVHILPNVSSVIIVIVSALIPTAILTEAALSFLGFGVTPPTPSWGTDLSGDSRAFFEVAPWLAIFPGAALSLTVLAFNLLGDALRDALDPRLRGGAR